MKPNPRLKAAIMQVVDNQLRANEPPETKQTLDRLLSEGHCEEEAKRLIGCVVSFEISDMLKEQEEFDLERFVSALHALPELSWEYQSAWAGNLPTLRVFSNVSIVTCHAMSRADFVGFVGSFGDSYVFYEGLDVCWGRVGDARYC